MWPESIGRLKYMRLDKYIHLIYEKPKCEICTFKDNFEDMIEVERDGEKMMVHKECLVEEQSKHK